MRLRNYRWIISVLSCGLLLSLLLLSVGCERGEPAPVEYPTITDPAQQSIVADWLDSKHADTYVISGTGRNNSCARCHSPLNWLPTDKADLPQSCQSCLVPFELSEPDTPIAEADWKSVECINCHAIEDGSAASEDKWLDMLQTMPGEEWVYTEVSSNTELCEQCHKDVDTSLYGRDLDPDHADTQCTDCHDAHSLETSCDDCHEEPITGTVHE